VLWFSDLSFFFMGTLVYNPVAMKLALGPLLAAAVFAAAPAQALVGFQNAGSYSFSGAGNGTFNFTPPKTFPGFKPTSPPIPANHLSPQLFGYRYYIKNTNLTGSLTVLSAAPTYYSTTTQLSLKFDNIVPPPPPAVEVEFTISGNTFSGTTLGGLNNPTTHNINTMVAEAYSSIVALPTTPPYTFPNTVTTDYFKTAWSITPDLPSGVFSQLIGDVNGTFGLEFAYNYVPGPLPLLGSAAAFGWSRRLRKRITKSKISNV
jgi:hypothetical protein